MPGVRQTVTGVVEAATGVAQTVVAPSVAIVDSFEDQDFSEYTASAPFTIDQVFVTDGNYSLTGAADNGTGSIVSESGLANYPSKGDIFKYDWQTTTDTPGDSWELRVGFAVDAANSTRYEIHHEVDGDNFELWERNPNSQLISETVVWEANTHYSVEVIWDDGTLGGADGDITLILTNEDTSTELVNTTVNSTLWNSGGIYLQQITSISGESQYLDYWRITNP